MSQVKSGLKTGRLRTFKEQVLSLSVVMEEKKLFSGFL